MALPLAQAITRLLQNEESLDKFVNGLDTESYVTRTGVEVPSIRKFLAGLKAQIIGIADQSPEPLYADLFVILSQKANLGSRVVADENYAATPTDVQVVYTSVSATRTLTLPNIVDYPYGQDLLVVDGSNSVSDTKYIRITSKPGTDQTINDGTEIALMDRNQAIRLRRASDTLWVLV